MCTIELVIARAKQLQNKNGFSCSCGTCLDGLRCYMSDVRLWESLHDILTL